MARRLLPLALALVLAVFASGEAAASVVPLVAPALADAEGDDAGPLDLRSASLGQRETLLRLEVRTAQPFSATDLDAGGDRSLCLLLTPVGGAGGPAELCVGASRGRAALRLGRHVVAAIVRRPDRRTLTAAFSPLAARLPYGRYLWQVRSRWTDDGACAAACTDLAPDAPSSPLPVSLLAEPAVFGAAARDTRHPCRNPALRTEVYPSHAAARAAPNAYCRLNRFGVGFVRPCAFGAAPRDARATIGLIGDSHAQHWRGALEVVAQAHRWRGLSVTRSSCPLSRAVSQLKSYALIAHCRHWNRDVGRWLRRRPQIHTVFLSANAGTPFHGDVVGGYMAAISRLPRSVRRVFVLRADPGVDTPQVRCVARAHARRVPAGPPAPSRGPAGCGRSAGDGRTQARRPRARDRPAPRSCAARGSASPSSAGARPQRLGPPHQRVRHDAGALPAARGRRAPLTPPTGGGEGQRFGPSRPARPGPAASRPTPCRIRRSCPRRCPGGGRPRGCRCRSSRSHRRCPPRGCSC